MATQPWIALFYFVLPPPLGRAVSCQSFVTPGDQFPEAQQGILEHLVTHRKFNRFNSSPLKSYRDQTRKGSSSKHHVFRIHVKLRGLYCGPLVQMASFFSTFWGWQKICGTSRVIGPINRKVWTCIAEVCIDLQNGHLWWVRILGVGKICEVYIYIYILVFYTWPEMAQMSSHIP